MARKLANTEVRFTEYLARLAEVIGHADRKEPLRAYMAGLLLPGERKSVEPMAAKVDPRNVESRHQSMHHFVADAPWDARDVIRTARAWALEQFERHGPIEARVIDDTGFPKKGKHSGRSGQAVLRRAWQAGQLSGGGEHFTGERHPERTGRVPSLPAGTLGAGQGATASRARSRRNQIPEEVADRTRRDRSPGGRRSTHRAHGDGRWLRHHHGTAR